MIQKLVGKKFYEGMQRYLKKHYPDEAKAITDKAFALFPEIERKAPDIGKEKNGLYINLDLFLAVVAYYEASDHRVGGEAIDEIIDDIFSRLMKWSPFLNINNRFIQRVLKKYVYGDYKKYILQMKENKGWKDSWDMVLGNREPEGLSFLLIGCPIAKFAKENGYQHLMPHVCAVDYAYAKLMHAKLVRNQTVAEGADYCDNWFVPDKSETAKKYAK